MKRVALIGSPDKPAAVDMLDRVRHWLRGRAREVFAEITYDSAAALPSKPDLIIVLGGDGTLIRVVHGLGQQQIPILGINLGKLGYLAEFTPEKLEREGEFLFTDGIPVTRRLLLEVCLEHPNGHQVRSPVVNDGVILAGAPFRMIEMAVESDGDQVADIRGDGLIVATPSGSTAHNLSAGGPILEPTAAAFILTPVCPHSLTYRPVVMDGSRVIEVRIKAGNEGTMVSIDGQTTWPFRTGDRLRVQRYAADFLLVRNPQYSIWRSLRRKLMWGAGPNTNGDT
ncbi:MAG: NAD(+)/NADH kinase [Phycisphaerae bacterium]|nr:NAD(+)/NADH kinase [Phycisphaerae bacterium]